MRGRLTTDDNVQAKRRLSGEEYADVTRTLDELTVVPISGRIRIQFAPERPDPPRRPRVLDCEVCGEYFGFTVWRVVGWPMSPTQGA